MPVVVFKRDIISCSVVKQKPLEQDFQNKVNCSVLIEQLEHPAPRGSSALDFSPILSGCYPLPWPQHLAGASLCSQYSLISFKPVSIDLIIKTLTTPQHTAVTIHSQNQNFDKTRAKTCPVSRVPNWGSFMENLLL